MKAKGREVVREMMASLGQWVKSVVADAETLNSPESVSRLERRVEEEGRQQLGRLLQGALQAALDGSEPSRRCPVCGGRLRHKGRRVRGPLSRLGALRLEGVYWRCSSCGQGEHEVTRLVGGSVTAWMEETLTLLGVSLASFEKAERVAEKVLGVPVDGETIRVLTLRAGRAVSCPPVSPVAAGADLVGSCDGTMVLTRGAGWKELKAYLFCHEGGRLGGAHLEPAERFVPRLRRAAMRLGASRAGRLFWVSDAAAWIDRGVASQLPMALPILDLWHARQHVYEAGEALYPKDEARGRRWGERWSRRLRALGGRQVLRWLERLTPRRRHQRRALATLRTYLTHQASRLDYPAYEAQGWPISSGPMESYCKQLGGRLKGPGMRWRASSVNPMGALVALWADNRWDAYWTN